MFDNLKLQYIPCNPLFKVISNIMMSTSCILYNNICELSCIPMDNFCKSYNINLIGKNSIFGFFEVIDDKLILKDLILLSENYPQINGVQSKLVDTKSVFEKFMKYSLDIYFLKFKITRKYHIYEDLNLKFDITGYIYIPLGKLSFKDGILTDISHQMIIR